MKITNPMRHLALSRVAQAATLLITLLLLAAPPAPAATFVVDRTDDGNVGGTQCTAAADDCTLRAAITRANANADADDITFNIPGSGVRTISVGPGLGALPAISGQVTIDGYTQPGASPNTLAQGNNAVLLIEFSGADFGTVGVGFDFSTGSSNSIVRGLVINRHTMAGIRILFQNQITIEGNFIGTDPTGNTAFGNALGASSVRGGIIISGALNTIGGTTPAARNIISGNKGHGMVLRDDASSSTIAGNYIGTNAAGTAKLPNEGCGISIVAQPGIQSPNLIGGTTAEARNVISGNAEHGIRVVAANDSFGRYNFIQGNFIGTDMSGTNVLGNNLNGVYIRSGLAHVVGGTSPGMGNTIAFNGGSGVQIDEEATSNAVISNSIFANNTLGIDLAIGGDPANFVTPNDPGDTDAAQNYPLLTRVNIGGGSTAISGTLDTQPGDYRIEFFANEAPDPTGHGEGQTFLGFIKVNANSDGDASFTATVPEVPAQRFISATATKVAGDTLFLRNTSEFSRGLTGAPAQSLNISTRLRVLTGEQVLIGGFIITGNEPKRVIIRGIGPSLPVPDALADPILELHQGEATLATNDNWKDTQQAEILASTIPPASDFESAIVRTLDPGPYTAILRGIDETTGIGLVEVYDLGPDADAELANISTRGFVDTGDNVMIGGFILAGNGGGNARIVIRALGPSLSGSGVSGVLADPTLALFNGNGTEVASNDDWTENQAEIEATGIPPSEDVESALAQTLAPGPYTAIVRGKENTTGVALVEVYNLK